MSWKEPEIDWSIEKDPTPGDFNRTEGNLKAIKEEVLQIDGKKTFTGNNIHSGTNEFQDDISIDGDAEITGDILRSSGTRIEPAGVLHGSYPIVDLYNLFAAILPNVGNKMIVTGSVGSSSGASYTISRIERTAANEITVYSIRTSSSALAAIVWAPGNPANQIVSIAW